MIYRGRKQKNLIKVFILASYLEISDNWSLQELNNFGLLILSRGGTPFLKCVDN